MELASPRRPEVAALSHGELLSVDWLRRQELDVRCSRRVAAQNYSRSALPTWVQYRLAAVRTGGATP